MALSTEIICIGKLKESYFKEACAEYEKRLAPYTKLRTRELKDEKQKGEGSAAEKAVISTEGERLLAALPTGSDTTVIALDPRGKKLDSEGFAALIGGSRAQSKSRLCFLIGGSLGLSVEVRRAADTVLSFSDLTFPHRLMRVILLEQLYRAHKILRGETYHK